MRVLCRGFEVFNDVQRDKSIQALHALPVIVWLAESFTPCSELAKEAEANAVLYRNTFGTQPKRALGPLQNAFDLYLKNPANTNVVLWGDRLLALWEVGGRGTVTTIVMYFMPKSNDLFADSNIATISSMSVARMVSSILYTSLCSTLLHVKQP